MSDVLDALLRICPTTDSPLPPPNLLEDWVYDLARAADAVRDELLAASPPAADPLTSASSEAEGLDVERLAEALYESGVRQTMSQAEASARNVAAEYARLAREGEQR